MTGETLNQTWKYVEKWAQEIPQSEAFVFGNERIRWYDFKQKMDLTAKALLEAGIEKGDCVALLAMARLEFPIVYMAANKVGAKWLGLSPKYPLDELRYMVEDSRPKVLVCLREFLSEDLADKIKSLIEGSPFIRKCLVIGEPIEGTESFEAWIQRPRNEFDARLKERIAQADYRDEALLLYTSGSTGKPKGVVHTHESILENVRVQNKKFYIFDGHIGICHFPINHVAGATEMAVSIIMAGACCVFMERFDPVETLRNVEKEKVKLFFQAPVMFVLEIKQPEFQKTDFSRVETFIWAGAAAPKIMLDTLLGICQKTGARLITGYGSTETCGFITYSEPGDDYDILSKSAGKIAPPFELKIVDHDRKELPDGEVGEIAVRGPFLMKGYLNKPEATAAVIDKEGWFYTSDLAYKDDRGYIYISGRKSEMFKSGAENVFPREVENILESHDSVLFAAVLGVPDEVFQEVGWAFIMLKPDKTATEEELKNFSKSRLVNFKVPKRFFIRSSLPMLPIGKVSKVELKKEVAEIMKKANSG